MKCITAEMNIFTSELGFTCQWSMGRLLIHNDYAVSDPHSIVVLFLMLF